jgi:prophage regulatory protein
MNTTQSEPKDRFLRLEEVLKIISVSKTTWWSGVKSGKFPQSIKLTARTTVWSELEIYAFIDEKKKMRLETITAD